MATLPLPPLVIDAGEDTEPAYDGATMRATLGALLTQSSSGAMTPRSGALDTRAFRVTISGSTVNVQPGGYVVGYSGGAYIAAIASQLTVDTLDAADATNGRIDRVVLRIDDPTNGGRDDKTASVELVKGTPAANPNAPAVSGTTRWAELAQITVPRTGGGSPAITDKRAFTNTSGGPVAVASQADMTALAGVDGTLAYRSDVSAFFVRAGGSWKQLQMVDLSKDSGVVTSGFLSHSTGWSISYQRARRLNGVVFFELRVKRTGAKIKAPANGNITNEKLAIFNSGWQPQITAPVVTNSYGPMGAGGVSPGDNSVYIASLVSNAVIDKGDEINCSGSFVVA